MLEHTSLIYKTDYKHLVVLVITGDVAIKIKTTAASMGPDLIIGIWRKILCTFVFQENCHYDRGDFAGSL